MEKDMTKICPLARVEIIPIDLSPQALINISILYKDCRDKSKRGRFKNDRR